MTGPLIFTPEYYARMRHLESQGWWNAGMRDVAERLLRFAGLAGSGRMLDVGCGSGQTMAWFRELYPSWQTYGLDVAEEGLAGAKRFGESNVIMASALQIPLPDSSVSLVVTLDMLQHLPLPRGDMAALAEIWRVLSAGGHLFIRTNAQSFPRTADDLKHDFRKYGPSELEAKLSKVGFDVLRLSRLNALLGLAEIPRESRAKRQSQDSYHGLLATTGQRKDALRLLKRGWLRIEGWMATSGAKLPFGRTLIALCRKP